VSAKTTIEWATRSWNPVRGCSRVSPGCDNCYAMGQAHRFAGPGKPYEGLTTIRKGKVDWSGTARFIPAALDEPLRWRKPERVFVNSMSDLFHHSLTDAEILRVWMVMARCPQHEFLVLTKRPERALKWLTRWADVGHPDAEIHLAGGPAEVRAKHTEGRALMWAEVLDGMGEPPPGAAFPTYDWQGGIRWWPVELPNVWLGVSVENQATADERIRLLLECPAAVHWVSAEPLLGPVDLEHVNSLAGPWNALRPSITPTTIDNPRRVDWVVVGGESGPGARKMNIAWLRSVVERCQAAGVPVFCKQFGAKPYENSALDVTVGGPKSGMAKSARMLEDGSVDFERWMKHRKGADLTEIPGDWPREFPGTV
jgi:protein gp37